MAYSVLTIGSGSNSHGLYDSTRGAIVLTGGQDEMFEHKHILENSEQMADNKAYMEQLRIDRLHMLVTAGNSKEKAETFLRLHMPYLWQ